MRTLAIILAVAYLVGVALFLPGRHDQGGDHQVSVNLATVPSPAPQSPPD